MLLWPARRTGTHEKIYRPAFRGWSCPLTGAARTPDRTGLPSLTPPRPGATRGQGHQDQDRTVRSLPRRAFTTHDLLKVGPDPRPAGRDLNPRGSAGRMIGWIALHRMLPVLPKKWAGNSATGLRVVACLLPITHVTTCAMSTSSISGN